MKPPPIALIVWIAALSAAPALAQVQVDISGEWAARVHEDQPHRGPGAELGDYTGLPINAAARQKASHWDASILSLPERMAQPHPAQYFMRGPGPHMRISKRTDPVTHQLVAYTLEGRSGVDDRIIWMDGRPHPSEHGEHVWEGFSTGTVERNRLVVTTTHMKYGVIQRNGVASSPKATMTEHFIRHGNSLTLVTIVSLASADTVLTEYFDTFKEPNGDTYLIVSTTVVDPMYLAQPFSTSTHFKKEADPSKWNPRPCEITPPVNGATN
jgi:hypothetical protein